MHLNINLENMNISIKKPCHENWNEMTPNEQGAFCGKCVKTVVDFSTKTIDEIKDFFNSTTEEKVCGRFETTQLTSLSFDDFYSKFNNKMIDQIDGTVDLRSFYQVCLLCFVDMFGKDNLIEFSLWLFRHIFSLRLHEQSRIYEPTVRNYIDSTKIIERIFHAYNYQEIISYLKGYITTEIKINGSQVKQRFFNKCSDFFSLENPSEVNFDEKLKVKIEEIVRSHKDEI